MRPGLSLGGSERGAFCVKAGASLGIGQGDIELCRDGFVERRTQGDDYRNLRLGDRRRSLLGPPLFQLALEFHVLPAIALVIGHNMSGHQGVELLFMSVGQENACEHLALMTIEMRSEVMQRFGAQTGQKILNGLSASG